MSQRHVSPWGPLRVASLLASALVLGAGASLGCSAKTHGLGDDPPEAEAEPGSAGRGTAMNSNEPGGSTDPRGTGEPQRGGSSGSGGDSGGEPMASPIDDPPSRPAIACQNGQLTIDKADVLFVVDDSGSMRQEQEMLRAELPRLIHALTSGDRDSDGQQDFPPVQDLHLGVVSSDMGLVGISDIEKCSGLGDDGLLLHEPSPLVTGCQPAYPLFLTYTSGLNDPDQTARDFACIATLGTDGCGFEQQLESALKALWPSKDPYALADGTNRITFLGDSNGFGQLGHGDLENAGFLRNDPTSGLSLIAVIMVTDEEDCSSADTSHFTPMHFLDPNDPLAMQDLNLRCFYNKQNLFPIERYVNGLRELRPGNEAMVLFAALAGVPPDLVDHTAREVFDLASPAEREAFYARIMDDPRMQERVDPSRSPEQGGNLIPSCNTANGLAYPPRRIVEVARGFGENGFVQSICEPDFGPAIDAIVGRIGERLRDPCAETAL